MHSANASSWIAPAPQLTLPPAPGNAAPPAPAVARGRCALGYGLFLLVNLILFVRPAEIVPALGGVSFYEVLILGALLSSLPVVLEQLAPAALVASPVSFFVLGMLPAVALSHLRHLYLGGAVNSSIEFLKIIIYYLLLVGLVHTPARLRQFLTWLFALVVVVASLSLLQYHKVIDIPSLREIEHVTIDPSTGLLVTELRRIRSTGIFHDPNDLCLVLVLATIIGLYRMLETSPPADFARRSPLLQLAGTVPVRVLRWGVPLGLFGYTLALTRSRGGFLAMLAGILTVLISRFGLRRTIPVSLVMLPVMFYLFAGRQTEISTATDTGQERIQIWAQGISLFKSAPIFGIGMGVYEDEAGMVAHNSFVHSYTELGLFGGSLFMGAFAVSWLSLRRAGRLQVLDLQMARLRAYVLAALVAYGLAIMTLSRPYMVPTYMVLGLAVAYLRAAPIHPRAALPRLSVKMAMALVGLSMAFIIAAYVFINLFVQWSGA